MVSRLRSVTGHRSRLAAFSSPNPSGDTCPRQSAQERHWRASRSDESTKTAARHSYGSRPAPGAEVGTLEDILEEIVGNITDEHDVPGDAALAAEADGSVVVRGNMSIREVGRAMGWDLPEEDAVTMAGLVIDFARRIPDVGESFTVHGYVIGILERDHTRLTKLRVSKAPDE
ncbi:hypothetical protein HUK65_16470 [Rhodobacteraceae bacterium 2376]|uniref:Transporter-associated domain-containing protein n=1 Tax=Rhabdonatronobacter sediminivivens TaxID=2743469 RepID=A0A7Z0I281_9RHOB|nr:transporter associated domain-containing protein [Rhabdonatronobacter sediminivivens]NYS26581.1 hypothetical protein [Rhabdonatronobacter sediminivivens]